MCAVVDLDDAFVVVVGVARRRRELCVTEHFLYGTHVGARFEEVGGKGMSQAVW